MTCIKQICVNYLEKGVVSLGVSLSRFSTIIIALFWKIKKQKRMSSKKGLEKKCKGSDHTMGLSIESGFKSAHYGQSMALVENS